jgi:hypothetical protein
MLFCTGLHGSLLAVALLCFWQQPFLDSLRKLRKKNTMTSLTENEVEYIMDYTGMNMLVHLPMVMTPVVHFSRNKNKINFVTILSDFMKGNHHDL